MQTGWMPSIPALRNITSVWNTAEAATNTIAGAKTCITYFTSGTLNTKVAIGSAAKNSNSEKASPKLTKNVMLILNILCAPFLSPIAILSETIFETILGIPIDESANSKEYIWYPVE